MRNITAYEEKSERYGLIFPIRVAHLSFPKGKGTLFYPHWHREFEFFFVTAGSAVFTVGGAEYRVSKGECVFVSSESLHTAKSAENMPCEFMAVIFYGSAICGEENSNAFSKYIAPVMDGTITFHSHYSPAGEWMDTLLKNFWDIERVFSKKQTDCDLFIRGKLCEIWNICFLRPLSVKAEKERNADKLRPVMEYIHHHYTEDLSLEQLAALAKLSVGQFCRVFKQYSGMTPVSYLNHHRIMQSCRLLSETNRSVTETANNVGFNNISYFNKVFRQIIGCTPSAYRKERMKVY